MIGEKFLLAPPANRVTKPNCKAGTAAASHRKCTFCFLLRVELCMWIWSFNRKELSPVPSSFSVVRVHRALCICGSPRSPRIIGYTTEKASSNKRELVCNCCHINMKKRQLFHCWTYVLVIFLISFLNGLYSEQYDNSDLRCHALLGENKRVSG